MTIEQIRKLHQAKPFRPFMLNLANGQSIRVTHPELMTITPGGRTAFVATEQDAGDIIDLFLVLSVSLSAPGKSKARRR